LRFAPSDTAHGANHYHLRAGRRETMADHGS